MALTPNHIRRDVACADDVRIETRKVEFVDILMEADFWCEDEATTIGVVECAHRFVELVSPGVPRDQYAPIMGLTDLDCGEDVPDRSPREFLNWLFRP